LDKRIAQLFAFDVGRIKIPMMNKPVWNRFAEEVRRYWKKLS
jgi:hypothetical protein